MFGGFEEHLFAARLQSFDRSSQKDFRLSSAALKTWNIYLAFVDGKNLADIAWDTPLGGRGFQTDDSKQFKKAKAIS